MGELDKLFSNASGAFSHPKIAEKARKIAYGNLTCMGRRTITGMITSGGNQFLDWSSFYRLFSRQRVDIAKLNAVCLKGSIDELGEGAIVAHMDDTIIKKTGKNIPGTSWRRDPLGPPFHTNFIWGQRFIQMSLAIPENQHGACQSRAIPIGFYHCPTPKKPVRNASQEEIATYREVKKQSRLSLQGVHHLQALRENLDQQGHVERTLCIGVDGSYTNSTVLKNLPDRTTLIGRIRKDTKLHLLPEQGCHPEVAGRKKVYGEVIPTPEQVRQSPDYPWQSVEAWAAGKKHQFDIKVIKDLKWRVAGKEHTLQLMVVRPLAYRLNAHSRLLYRQPAYLICTDNEMPPEEILQNYIWRWEIEVNIRDEKTLIGCGQAQVRNEHSAADVPSFVSAMYAFLLLASIKAYNENEDRKNRKILLPRPKWYPAKKEQRFTSGDLVNHLRTEMWAKAMGCGNFSGFVSNQHYTKNRRNVANPLSSSIFYSRK
jgi:hypothetical protein